MRNPELTTAIVIGRTTNVIKSEPVHGQMTFQDNVITTPVTLEGLVSGGRFNGGGGGGGGEGGGGITGAYVTTVNAISGAISIVKGNGIDVITAPNGQITISLYQSIFAILNGGSFNEIGSTVSSVALSWIINKTETSQSLDQGIGSLAVGVRSYNYTTPITSNTTFTLTASDGTLTTTPSITVSFYNRRWWGTSANPSFASADILTLSNSEFSTSRYKSWSQNGNGQYIYYCYPSSFGTATFTINGLLNTAWTLTVVSHTNQSGHTENYNVYRSNNIQNGTGISIVVS